MIPDLAERQEKADELEEQFMQTTVASEDEEYNREQDIYSQDEVNMSLVARNPVFGVSDQVLHKPGCTATEDG